MRLRLDNNGIVVMEGLDELVHLTWLDLSFNKIERIAVRSCTARAVVSLTRS